MPRIPVLENDQTVAPAPAGGLKAPDFGPGIGGNVVQLGQAGADFAQAATEQRAQIDDGATKQLFNGYVAHRDDVLHSGPDAYYDKSGAAVLDAKAGVVASLQTKANDLIASATSQRQRTMLTAMLTPQITEDVAGVGSYYDKNSKQYNYDQSESSVQFQKATAGNNYRNPDRVADAIATIDGEVDTMAGIKGWDPTTTKLTKFKAISDIHTDVGSRLARDDPSIGPRYVEVHGDQISNDGQEKILEAARVEQSRRDTELRRQQSEARQAQRESATQLGEDARDMIDLAGKGVTVDGQGAEKLATSLDGLGKGVLASNLRATVRTQTFTQQASQWKPEQLSSWIANAQQATAGGATPDQGLQLVAANKLLGEMRSGVSTDPLAWANKTGVGTIAPIDLQNPASVGARIKTAVSIADHYGQKPVFLTQDEAAGITSRLATMKADGKVQYVGTLANAFGRYTPYVLGSIASQDPVFAHAAGLASMGPAGQMTARAIFAGQDAIRDKAVSLPSDDDFMGSGDLNGAMRYTLKTRGAVYASAKAIYASHAAALNPKTVDEPTWRMALNEASGATYRMDGTRVGGLDSYHGLTIALPSSAAPGELGTLIGRVTDSDLKSNPPHYGNGKPATAADIHGGYLFDAGSGRYFVSLDQTGTQFLKGASGKPYVLDVGSMLPTLRGRAPQSTLGRVGEWLGM